MFVDQCNKVILNLWQKQLSTAHIDFCTKYMDLDKPDPLLAQP